MEIKAVRAKVTAQLDMARGSALTRAHGWVFEVDDLIAYVTLQHRRRPEHVYLLSVLFDDFPRRAPSYVFVD
jgi:hypothetical protein